MKDVAKHLASRGRHGDTMLVHMSPEEVAGLQYLALSSGGSLTINPDTGLVEAFKLGKLFKSLLPTIAGGLLAATGIGAPLAAALVGGATGVASGDWKKGLMAGIGAFGGAGIGKAIAGTGAAELGKQAATSAAEGLSKSAITVPGSGALAPITVNPALAVPSASTFAATAAPQAAMKAGLQAINPMTAAGRTALMSTAKNVGLKNAYAAAVPVMAGMTPEPMQAPPEAPPEFSMYQFNQGAVNPNFGKPGETYFLNRGFSAPTYTTQNPFKPQTQPQQPGIPDWAKPGMAPAFRGYAGGGGIGGEYAAGGKFLEGPGDGMSDDIKANIEGNQEARLADGEFVIPADVVSHLGNGSSKAGSRKLYEMMDKVRHARTGNSAQGKQINPDKFLPA